MKKKTILIAAAAAALSLGIGAKASADTDMYRLYNSNSGEHFYTATPNEKNNLVNAGWYYEGTGWVAPDSGKPVYRLYNPNVGDHFYTLSSFERDSLVKAGWNSEGIGWYSGGTIPLYRAYNPNAVAGSHNYTTGTYEQSQLIKAGWRDEGIAWYGVGVGKPAPYVQRPAQAPNSSSNTVVTQEMRDAVSRAQFYQRIQRFFPLQQLISVLKSDGFSSSEATYGANNAGIDWNINALENARGISELNKSKSEIYSILTNNRFGYAFTAEQAQYAIDHL